MVPGKTENSWNGDGEALPLVPFYLAVDPVDPLLGQPNIGGYDIGKYFRDLLEQFS